MNEGSWIRIRKGWSVPSETTYAAYWPRGPSIPAYARPGRGRSSRGSLAVTGPSGIWWRHWSMIRRLWRISSMRSR